MPHRDKGVKLTAVAIPGNPFTDTPLSPTSFLPDANDVGHEDETALQESQRISREIDDRLVESKKAWDKKKKAPQILLLGTPRILCQNWPLSFCKPCPGQSESGKVCYFSSGFSLAKFRWTLEFCVEKSVPLASSSLRNPV